jgi:hypothetical protein
VTVNRYQQIASRFSMGAELAIRTLKIERPVNGVPWNAGVGDGV